MFVSLGNASSFRGGPLKLAIDNITFFQPRLPGYIRALRRVKQVYGIYLNGDIDMLVGSRSLGRWVFLFSRSRGQKKLSQVSRPRS